MSAIAAERGFAANVSGRLNRVMTHFELEPAPGIRLSTHPDQVDRRNSWAHRVWGLREPLMLGQGRCCRLSCRYGVAGERAGVRVAPALPHGEDAGDAG